ncbi:hypothetical protein QQF64_009578 [Cirrhinus molitorella]|uniref:Uncharacterized protein n=1 Tax=Cirrhinus molitorella TaxID=172907 RepID=A0ABR3M426_9TELE
MQDSAEATDLQNFLVNTTSRMDCQDGHIVAIGHAVQDLHLGDRVKGPHSLRRGNASARMPNEPIVCAGEVTGCWLFGQKLVPFTTPHQYTGELIGVEYLYQQTGEAAKVYKSAIQELETADVCVEEDESYVEPVDIDDLTLSTFDEEEHLHVLPSTSCSVPSENPLVLPSAPSLVPSVLPSAPSTVPSENPCVLSSAPSVVPRRLPSAPSTVPSENTRCTPHLLRSPHLLMFHNLHPPCLPLQCN